MLQEQTQNCYRNLSKEKRDIEREYRRNTYKNYYHNNIVIYRYKR